MHLLDLIIHTIYRERNEYVRKHFHEPEIIIRLSRYAFEDLRNDVAANGIMTGNMGGTSSTILGHPYIVDHTMVERYQVVIEQCLQSQLHNSRRL